MAMRQSVKKFILSFSVILAFGGYALYQKGWFGNHDTSSQVAAPTSLEINQSNNISATNPSSNAVDSGKTSVGHNVGAAIGGYKDGAYIGRVADAYYGNLQVKAVIQKGKLIDVLFLQYPNDRRTSIEINTKATPYLKAEAIQIQNSEVDIVSGATQSTEGFRDSLKSALDQARI